MNIPPARIAAIHDLSCFGRCALTVVLPVLAVMGYQPIPVPTALLSTHTGGFDNLYFRDLTTDMEEITAHFDRLGVRFRSIYTGFLGSAAQIRTVCAFLDRFGKLPDESGVSPIILVDPVMGDDGELYSTYTPELMLGMREVSRHAQLLTPNLTEACFLTDTPFRDTAAMTVEEAFAFADKLLDGLREFCRARNVITGISLCDGRLANVGEDTDGSRFRVCRPHRGHAYPGTGDLFASVLLGSVLQGDRFEAACARAADFVGDVIEKSAEIPYPTRAGASFEPMLSRLLPENGNAMPTASHTNQKGNR